MAVTSVGTPTLVKAATTTVTAAWGTGQQPAVAGNLMVAVLTVGGATAAAATAQHSGTTGWTKLAEVWNSTGNTGNCLVAAWTKTSAGSDAAPAFDAAFTGTGAMTVTLYNLAGAVNPPVTDTTGSESSSGAGTGSATVSSTAVTTGAAPKTPGDFAIMVACRERAAANTTVTGSAGWNLDANDGGASSVLRSGVQSQAAPSTGGTLSGTITWSGTATAAFGAGYIAVFSAITSGPPLASSLQQPAGLVVSLVRTGIAMASLITGQPAPPPPVTSGPPFFPVRWPARARIPSTAPRGRVASNPGGPVSNPVPPVTGPVFYPARRAIRARLPQPPAGMGAMRGRRASNPGAPAANPGVVQVSGALGGPVRASLPVNLRGRVRVTPLVPASGTPPAHSGPPFFPAVQALRARLPQQPVLRGRTASRAGSPARNPSAGPAFRQAVQPARAVIPQVFSKGRAASNPGAPARNPSRGPVFTQAPTPARTRPSPPSRGRTASNAGGPVRNPVPGGTGPVFYPRNSAKAQLPLPRRGICRAIRFGPLPANPAAGPVFTQAVTPARARTPLPPRGRIASNPGGPVQNPPPVVQGPPFFPVPHPVRVHPVLPPRGRTAGSQGAPVRNPFPGAAFPAPHGPVQARFPLPPRGRASGNPGIPVPPRLTPAPVYPLHGPVAARFPLPPRGRTAGNPGGPVANPVTRTGPPFFPLHWPARIRPALPPRGRVAGSPGAAVRNPRPGPVFVQAVRPIRAVIPQNAPRGRVGGNPGGPVANIPFGNPLFRTGQPRFQWDTEVPGFQWETASPGTAWATGVPVTS